MRRILFPLTLIAGALSMYSMPAKQTLQTIVGPDGKEIVVRQIGDENFHYYVSVADESILLRDGDKFINADVAESGQLIPVNSPVKVSARSKSLQSQSAPRRIVPGLVSGTTFPAQGNQKVAVVLVEYQDVKFNLEDPMDYFTRMLNEEGFSDYYATGSARDWFLNSSAGKFDPEFIVMGPVTLQKNMNYYGGNDAWGQDNAPQKMVIEACRQLNADVDFSQFDCDKDGYIDNVFVVYAGRGEASGGSSDTVWPHAWTLSSAEPGQQYSFDGVRLNRYACSNEWELSDAGYGYRPVGIGTFVHEFSHVMGLPDLYSTQYVAGTFTPGGWSAMDYGPYNNDGCTPPQFSAWERASLGWYEPLTFPDSGNIALEPFADGDAYLIPTERDNEFFMIENRQQKGWDEFVPGHGMLVWHIDYDESVWRQNAVNNTPSHNRVDIIEADGTTGEDNRDGDAFPGVKDIKEFTATSSPAFVSRNGKSVGFDLTDITERGERIVFRLNGGDTDIVAPVEAQPSDIKAASFVANWEPVENARCYELTVLNADNETVEFIKTNDTHALVSNLTPSTDYSYTVVADDGAYGSLPSGKVDVRTLDPTFDYFAPEALDPKEVLSDSFVACWAPMEDAQEYFLTVTREDVGDPVVVESGFDSHLDNLPEGWSTNSAVTYGMAAYCGVASPSLRLSKDNDELLIENLKSKNVQSLKFWHRGNSTSGNEELNVELLADNEWHNIAVIPVDDTAGGVSTDLDLKESWTADNPEALRIVFKRPAKGSVAIDDVVLVLEGDKLETPLENYTDKSVGNDLEHTVAGLDPGQVYCYTVRASDGELSSLISSKIKVKTLDLNNIDAVSIVSDTLTIRDRQIDSLYPVSISDATGRVIALSKRSFTFPSAGLYILYAEGKAPVKIFVK